MYQAVDCSSMPITTVNYLWSNAQEILHPCSITSLSFYSLLSLIWTLTACWNINFICHENNSCFRYLTIYKINLIVTVCGLWLLQTLSVCVSVCLTVCLCVCPAFTAYILLTIGRIVIKLGENVGTSVRLIVWKFHKNRLSVEVIITAFLLFFESYF